MSRPSRHIVLARWGFAVGIFFITWEMVGVWGDIFAVPPLHSVLVSLWHQVQSGEIWSPTAGTLVIAGIGYGIAAVLGVVVGFAMGLSNTVRVCLDPIVNAAYATPMTMLIPVIGLYFGLGESGQVFLVVTFCIFLVIINTATGTRQVPIEMYELARKYGLSRFDTIIKVVLPYASPYVVTGLRLSIAKSVAGAITAELLMATQDLGLYLSTAGSSFDIERLIGATLFVAALGAIVAGAGWLIERRLIGWSQT